MIECISISSSSSEEDPLQIEDINCTDYSGLCKFTLLQCDFCDQVFENRFSLIKHNASHIIIPLVKQTYQCTQCLNHFSCEEDLNSHTTENHKQIKPPLDEVKIKDGLQNKIDILQSIVEKEVFVKCENDLKDVFVECKNELNDVFVKCENELKDVYGKCNELNSNRHIIGQWKKEPETDAIIKKSLQEENIKNRLLFEDDEDLPLNNFTTNYRPKITPFDRSINGSVKLLEHTNSFNGFRKLDNDITINNALANKDSNVIYPETIHYEKLIEPSNSECQHCVRRFPNRFQLLKHESKHIGFRRFRQTLCGFCEKYLNGNYHNLRRHIDSAHPGKSHKKFNYHKCKKCKLIYFNYTKHFDLYHATVHCKKCNCGFETQEQLDAHECFKVVTTSENSEIKTPENFMAETSAVMKLCNLCFSFMKSYIQNRSHNYVILGEFSEIGVQQTCDKCNNKFFAVKLVKRKRIVMKDHLRHKVKPLSNTDRLKRVQQRLKQLQNRNKF